jgi:hypothetical protein
MNNERSRLLSENRSDSLRTWRGQQPDENRLPVGQAGGSGGFGEVGDPNFYIIVDDQPGTPGGLGGLYIVNVVSGESRYIGTPYSPINRLTGLAMDPVDNVLWSIQDAPGHRIISFSEEAGLIGLFNPTFYAVKDITIGADRIIRGWTSLFNQTMVYSRINGGVTLVANTGISGQNVGVANTEEAGVCYVKSNNQLWSVNWSSGEYINVCGYVPEARAGYNDPMTSAFGNWFGDQLIGVRRNLDNTESTFYQLTTDGGITTLASVPLAVYGVAWAPGRSV